MNEGKELVGVELCIHKEACDVGEAVKKAIACSRGKDDKPLFILAYTPAFCGFVMPSDGGLVALEGPKKNKFNVNDVFELRCFCEDFELRWVRGGEEGKGRAVILSEKELDGLRTSQPAGKSFNLFGWTKGLAPFFPPKETSTRDEGERPHMCEFFKRPGQYILWGKGAKRDGGIRLFEHRVGELPLPPGVSVSEGKRVCLNFVEYFQEDKYGNMTWHSERLTGLSPMA